MYSVDQTLYFLSLLTLWLVLVCSMVASYITSLAHYLHFIYIIKKGTQIFLIYADFKFRSMHATKICRDFWPIRFCGKLFCNTLLIFKQIWQQLRSAFSNQRVIRKLFFRSYLHFLKPSKPRDIFKAFSKWGTMHIFVTGTQHIEYLLLGRSRQGVRYLYVH